MAKWLKRLPSALNILTEINLAIFYLRGNYYDFVKRVMGVHYVCAPILHYASFLIFFNFY